MAQRVRVELNHRNIADILKSNKVRAHLDDMAGEIARRAGPGMEATSMIGRNRARASVITATHAARRAEATDRALTVAFGGSSGPAAAAGLTYTTKSGRTRSATAAQIANWTRGSQIAGDGD